MKPRTDKTRFDSITIKEIQYSHDILIRLDGQVKKRKKKLSKAISAMSHTISFEEARYSYRQAAPLFIIGCGKFDSVRLSKDAEAYFKSEGCKVKIWPTLKAVRT